MVRIREASFVSFFFPLLLYTLLVVWLRGSSLLFDLFFSIHWLYPATVTWIHLWNTLLSVWCLSFFFDLLKTDDLLPVSRNAFRCKTFPLVHVCMLNLKTAPVSMGLPSVFTCLKNEKYTHWSWTQNCYFSFLFNLLAKLSFSFLGSGENKPFFVFVFLKGKYLSYCLSFIFSLPSVRPALNKQIFKDCLECIWGGDGNLMCRDQRFALCSCKSWKAFDVRL